MNENYLNLSTINYIKINGKPKDKDIIDIFGMYTLNGEEKMIIAYYDNDSTFNDNVILANINYETIYEFKMIDHVVGNEKRQCFPAIMFSPDCTQLLINNMNTMYIYSTITGELINKYNNGPGVEGISISNDNKIACIIKHVVNVYSNTCNQLLFSYIHKWALETTFSPDNTLIMSKTMYIDNDSNNMDIKIYNMNGDFVYKLIMPRPNNIIKFTPDNNIIYFKGMSILNDFNTFDANIYIWDIKNEKMITKIENELININNIKFSKDGKYIYCEINEEGLKVIDSTDYKTVKRYCISYSENYFYNSKYSFEYLNDYKYMIRFYNDTRYYKQVPSIQS